MKKEELKFTEILEGERIKLKLMNPTLENSKMLFDLIDKNRKHLEPWFRWVRETKDLFDAIKFQVTKKNEIQYGIFDKKDIFMGIISIMSLDLKNNMSGGLMYWIGEEFTGKGYMSEAVRILEKEFFENFGLNKIVIKCNVRNKASEMVARKNNYFLEGVSRQDNNHTGKLEDYLNFSKLKSEYENSKK